MRTCHFDRDKQTNKKKIACRNVVTKDEKQNSSVFSFIDNKYLSMGFMRATSKSTIIRFGYIYISQPNKSNTPVSENIFQS